MYKYMTIYTYFYYPQLFITYYDTFTNAWVHLILRFLTKVWPSVTILYRFVNTALKFHF